MSNLFACSRCGTVRSDESGCRACGNDEFDALDVGGDEYACDECGDTFDTKAGLNSHQRVHVEDADSAE